LDYAQLKLAEKPAVYFLKPAVNQKKMWLVGIAAGLQFTLAMQTKKPKKTYHYSFSWFDSYLQALQHYNNCLTSRSDVNIVCRHSQPAQLLGGIKINATWPITQSHYLYSDQISNKS